jgi:uncharacterized protein (DUF2147 family)
MKRIFTILVLSGLALVSFAAEKANKIETAAGTWRTFNEETNKPEGEVIIYEENGLYYGKIGKSLDPKDEGKKLCKPCKDEFHNQPIEGLRFMWDFKRSGDEYNNGKILDPNTGEIYSAEMHLEDDGQTLILRGYLGIPMFGRSQEWERVK